MSRQQIYAILAAAVVLFFLLIVVGRLQKRFLRKKLDPAKFLERWKKLQQLCHDKSTWPLAIIDADKLLDDALKRSGYKGKSMGERLVSAERTITDRDSAWFAHKLRNKLVHEHDVQLKESMVKDALKGIRSALRDLGALE